MISSNPTLAIAQYIYDMAYADLPRQAIVNAKLAILDTLGVMFAGSQHRVGQLITDYVQASGAAATSTVVARPYSPGR